MLITRAPTEGAHRLHRLLQPSPIRTLGAVLLGPWPEGTTLTTDTEGQVTHTHPDISELLGTRLFTATPTPTTARELTPLTPTPTRRPDNHTAGDTPHEHPPQTNVEEPVPPPDDEERPEACGPAVGVTLRVFGRITLLVTDNHGQTHDITEHLTSRQRELLAYLALHPDGVSRDTLITDLWHEPHRNRPTNALNTLLTRLRSTLSQATSGTITELTDSPGQHRYRLNPQQVRTDYAHFTHLETTSHHTTDTDQRLALLDELVTTYTGPLAGDLDTEWIQAPRYQAQRSFINAISTLARHRHTESPERTLDLLESALHHDPYNEFLYRDIMRLQHHLDMPHNIAHTLQSLTTRLTDIDTEPSPETTTLAHQLCHHNPSQNPPPSPT